MRRAGGLPLLACLLTGAAHADVRIPEETAAISMPYARWELSFPGADWRLQQQRRAGDGGQFYYLFVNPRQRLIASFYLEPAYKCESGEACRERFWTNPGPGYPNRANDRQFTSGPFAVVEFTSELGGILQSHWSAHTVHEGVWIDMHLSTTASDAGFSKFKPFADELAFGEKADCPECVDTRGIPRQESQILFAKARDGDAAALERLRKLADGNDPEAQFMLARLYSWGTPQVKQDERESVAWTRKAAELGHVEAQSNLAFFYVSGRGLDAKDPAQALQWWTRAAEQGFAPAQFSMANFYALDPQLKDGAKHFQWMEKAAAQGLPAAQVRLGRAYMSGTGTARNAKNAMGWFARAARQGSEEGIFFMAAIYAATRDPKLLAASVGLLNDPLLAAYKPAREFKAKICAASPEACARPGAR
jgi:TPR repeat protein